MCHAVSIFTIIKNSSAATHRARNYAWQEIPGRGWLSWLVTDIDVDINYDVMAAPLESQNNCIKIISKNEQLLWYVCLPMVPQQ